MKRTNPERDLVMLPLIRKMESDPDIIDVLRVACYQIGTIRVGEVGRWDIMAIVDCGNGKIALWYIETKAPSKKRWELDDLPYEQRRFYREIMFKPMTGFSIINDPAQYASEKRRIQAL